MWCVLLDRVSYDSKMNVILSDSSKFKLDVKQEDSTKKIESKLSSLLREVVQQNVITEQFRHQLLSSGHSPPRLYALPKTHKPDIPLRPILSMSGTPTHKTASWLAKALLPVKEHFSNFCVKDSFEFVNKIRNLHVNDNTMVSFDIKSLFTSVPINEVIDVILSILSDNNLSCELNSISPCTLRSLLELCVKDV